MDIVYGAQMETEQNYLSYDGRIILSDDSLLRNLPNIIDSLERMQLDAIVLAADMIAYHWQHMRASAITAAQDPEKITQLDRVAMISSAWSIIDRLECIRLVAQVGLARIQETAGSKLQKLIDSLQPVNTIRNCMDHLGERLDNFSKAKGDRSALFGSLAYAYCGPEGKGPFRMAVIQAGMLHNNALMPFVNPVGRKNLIPVDHFELTAFGETVDLVQPVLALEAWLQGIEPQLREKLSSYIKQTAAERGIAENELWEHSGGSFALFLDIAIPEHEGE